jgi:hypothetical protein
MRNLSVKATLLGLLVLSLTAPLHRACAQSTGAPTLSVDAAASRNPISPDIYGIASYGLDATFAREIQVANIRWGGDGTSRYNWEVDSSNSGYDWYFMGGSGAATAPTPGASPDLMVNTYKPAHANALITIPILPYVNKSYAWSCSFPVSEYGDQTSTNPYVFPIVNGVTETCGNSIATVATNGSTQLLDHDILANHISNTTALQQGWVQHLVSTFGTAAGGGVKYYQLDNEPLGWSNTHRDVQPNTATYATIVQLGQAYAAAVKQKDGSALILGPSDFTLGGWVGTASQQGGLWAGQYYLQQMAAYDQTNHLRLLDYFDEHYYFDISTPAAQLASTRTLWDPTYNGGTWVEQYDFNGPMQLIPRFKNWINTYYPGTKLSLSEYSIDSGQKSIVDAIAEMDVLGIFGREQLDFANMWSPPAPTDPIAYSFRMFRNYDGNGHQFGDTSISAVSSDQGSLSLYAAQRTSDNAVTILAINKTTAPITSAIALANLSLPPAAQVYVYSAANFTSIVQSANATITAGTLSYTFPSYSAVMFVVQPSLLATTTTVTASANQLTAGATVTFKVTVTASGATPSGSISLMDGSTLLGTSLTNGAASFPVSSLATGSHTITASYAGNLVDAPSTSSVVVQVGAAAVVATSTTLLITPTSTTPRTEVSFTATVTPTSGTNAPTGTVMFKDGATTLGSAPLSAGKATYSDSALAVGNYAVTAVYGGDADDDTSTSSATTVTITTAIAAPPTGLTATAGNGQVTLSWTMSTGATSYDVYEGTSAGGESKTPVQSGISGTTTAITGLTNGTGYFFTVASVDAGGTSAPSSEASASPVAPSSGSSHGGGSLSGSTLLALLLLAVLRFFDPRFSLRKPVTRGRLLLGRGHAL